MTSLTTYTNWHVSFRKDTIFGWCVLAEFGWMPISQLDKSDLQSVYDKMDNMPIFPNDLYDAVRNRLV